MNTTGKDVISCAILKVEKIKVQKLHPDAVLPKSANSTDAGYDLVAVDDGTVSEEGYIQYRTGIAISPPEGFHTEIFPRSSISKYSLALANSIGLVDNGYSGEILVRFKFAAPLQSHGNNVFANVGIGMAKIYKKGDRIAQLVVRKTRIASFEWVDELAQTERGTGGFGSSSR